MRKTGKLKFYAPALDTKHNKLPDTGFVSQFKGIYSISLSTHCPVPLHWPKYGPFKAVQVSFSESSHDWPHFLPRQEEVAGKPRFFSFPI